MDTGVLFGRFDGQSRLLVRALLSGASGPLRALDVLHRQQRSRDMVLSNFIDALCQEDIYCGDTGAQSLTAHPLVCLFPTLFKQNLLSFLHLVKPVLPQTVILRLLKSLSQDHHPSPWVTAMAGQVKRNMGLCSEEPLYTPKCGKRLKELSQRLVGCMETGGWTECFSSSAEECGFQRSSGLSELGTQRKRKGNFASQDSDDEEAGQKNKRMKCAACVTECIDIEEPTLGEELPLRLETDAPAEAQTEEPQPEPDHPCDSLPEHIMVTVRSIKEVLVGQTEWDQSSSDLFKVLNECDPSQVELLCDLLSFPDLPEPLLPKLCSSILAPSLDISYSTAATLIRSLLLEKVLSLSEPATRCLVTTAMSLCSHCPRPMCHALIEPVLQHENIGNSQAELLNRLIEGCLDSHYKLLVLQMTLKIAWSEAVLSIIHSLLDSKLDLSAEIFAQLTGQLVGQGPQFTKSVKFAKMMLTVLTKYSTHVTASHKHSLSGCLMLNETFLKKPLQAALKRITES